jgi:hypothetical protein
MGIKAVALTLFTGFCGHVFAQDAVNGRLLYNTPFGAGTPSCANSNCHGADPRQNIARIQNGTTPSDIFYAIERFGIMAFLRGRISSDQAADLAAYIANPAAASNVATAALSTPSITFEPIFYGQTSRAMTVTVSNAGAASLTISSVSIGAPNFVVSTNGCVANTRLLAGTACEIEVVFTPERAGLHTAQLIIAHNGQNGGSVVALSATADALPANTRLMIEYRISSLDYYFMTSRPNEQAALDAIADVRRTGASFPVYATAQNGVIGLTRYYFDQVAKQGTRGSHFYTALTNEIAALNQINPSNAAAPKLPFNEGVDSFAATPQALGATVACASGQQPVYRLFRGNERFPDDPNHRFTIDRRTYDVFVAAGWDAEGVVLCVPLAKG